MYANEFFSNADDLVLGSALEVPNNPTKSISFEHEELVIYLLMHVNIPWVRRALDGFLAVLSPCPEIRRNHLPSWS
jgi:hypothetical protein